jgi:nodulation protein E
MNVQDFWHALRCGQPAFNVLPQPSSRPLRFIYGATVTGFDSRNYFDRRELAFLDRFAQFGAVAARQAIEPSGLYFDGELCDRTAVILGSSLGGQYTEEEVFFARTSRECRHLPFRGR